MDAKTLAKLLQECDTVTDAKRVSPSPNPNYFKQMAEELLKVATVEPFNPEVHEAVNRGFDS